MTGNNPAPRQGPQQIDRYIVVECIGRGAMGVVYRARDEAVGRDVAIKLLVADLEDEPDIRTRFMREAETTARLTHPNIITIFDIGEDKGRLYIVMELLRGATLKDYLKQNEGLSLGRKLDLMIELCSGLGAAHSAGVYHRDIKPGNLFIRTDGVLKILDFGIARLASSAMTRAGFILGTPDYMSPEQARGGTVDARSDIFSVGSVLYFMITGRKPFAATDLPTIFRQVESQDPPPLTDAEAPPDLARVLSKAMAKNVALRHQSCQELIAEITEIRRRFPREARRIATARSVAGADTDETSTARGDRPKTAHTDKPPTAHRPPTVHADKPQTAGTGKLPTAPAEKPQPAAAEKLQTGATEKPQAGAIEKPQAAATEKPQAAATEKPQAAATEKPQAAVIEKRQPAATAAEMLQAAVTEKLQPATIEKLRAAAAEKRQAAANAEKRQPAATGKPQTAAAERLPTARTDKPPTAPTDKPRTAEVRKSEPREITASAAPPRAAGPSPTLHGDDTATLSPATPLRLFTERVVAFFSSVVRRMRTQYAEWRALRRKG